MCNGRPIIESDSPKLCEVNKVVRNNKVTDLQLGVYRADGVCSDNSLNAKLVQGINIRSIIHHVWGNQMMPPMTGQERDRFAPNLSYVYCWGESIWRSNSNLLCTRQ